MSRDCRVISSGKCEITQNYIPGQHKGIDLVNENYTLGYISAHSAGVVEWARNDCTGFESGSYGNQVVINHGNGYKTRYAHLDSVNVSIGQSVNRGDILGYMGNTGESYGGHLHFEVLKDDIQIDPTDYLNADLPSVIDNEVNAYYCVRTQKHGWLPEVKNLNDYAGFEDSPITDVAIKVDKGTIKYRVKLLNGEYLPYVTGYDINDVTNGYAGNGQPIEAVEVYYFTPDNIRPYKKAKYKVNNYDWQYDNETSNSQDGYAGCFGVPVTKFQIIIE